VAERLLAVTIRDRDWRESILGDLREEFVTIARRRGPRQARRWYWSQALAVGARGVMGKLRPRRAGETLLRSAEIEAPGGWQHGMSRDLRHALRTLARRPGATIVIVSTLALALATNSTSYTIMDAIVLRPFRFPGVERVVMVASSAPQNRSLFDRESVSPGDFADFRRDARTITDLSAAEWWDANLSGIDQPEQVAGFKVTSRFFAALDARPVLGRTFVADEETPGNHRRVILGHALWSRIYSADPQIVGRMIRVDGEPHEVVGVAPPAFAIPEGAQLWAPLAYTAQEWANRRSGGLITVARLADGATLGDARAELTAIGDRLRREYPETNANVPTAVVSFMDGMADPGAGPFMATIVAASVLLLLIACANIANLLLAHGAERSQEFAMRLALGAGRARLACQLMIEAGLLAAIAVAAAIPLAWVGLGLARASIPPAIVRFVPGWQYLDISPVVFWSTAAFGVLATVAFALLPAWHSVRANVADTLRQGARTTTGPRHRQWVRHSLAAAQVALTVALLFGAGLVLSAADSARRGVLGFDSTDLLVARLVLPDRPYQDAEKRRRFFEGVLDRVRAIPAVSHASMTSSLPYSGGNAGREFWIDGVELGPGEVRRVDFRRITANYFETMRIPLVAGRTFDDGDRADTQDVAIVSRLVAERYFRNDNPIGRQFRLAKDGPPITVIGVVGDVVQDWFQQYRAPTVYRPLAQDAPFAHWFVIRTVGAPASVAGDLRRAVGALDADQPIMTLQSMEDQIDERTAGLTFIARALGIVAFIALVLALMGLYSLMSFMVSRRTQEMGVRMALGATAWQVIGLTTRQGMRVTVAGLVVGVVAALGVGQLMESVLFGVVSASAWQLVLLVAAVGAVSFIASYIPARRTAALDPTTALRAE
jgi:putative ABC transport system permease protein